ncbi:MAG: mannose-6-phosphate isomerase, class I [Spirochaetales bacterium]|nr:mannose-6-phosphate isomerase, class I [Spirochaetales bacterium]
MAVYKLENVIQHYAWGSPDDIPRLIGLPNKQGVPFAEIWMGAHPQAPSRIPALGTDLQTYVKDNAERVFNSPVSDGKLPFLFKVLAASSPLSLQAHPDLHQAAAGFDRENRAGIPLNSVQRNYKDPNHKPEIIVALTPFWAMSGFLSSSAIEENLTMFTSPAAQCLLSALKKGGIQSFFHLLVTMEASTVKHLLSELAALASERTGPVWDWIKVLCRIYPEDPGCLGPLFLRVIKLHPGEGMYVPAGTLHSYLSGMGVELMASSDNVLRGGLTQKHIDIPELIKVLCFEETTPAILHPESGNTCLLEYDTPAKEFHLSRIQGAADCLPLRLHNRGPSILLNTGDSVVCSWEGQYMDVAKGESVFIEGVTGSISIQECRGKELSLFRAGHPA